MTVNRPTADVRQDGKLPDALQRLAEEIDVRVRPAPGDRGTELAVRLKEPTPAWSSSVPARLAGQDPRQEIRLALREAKAVLEAGEVLRPDTPPTSSTCCSRRAAPAGSAAICPSRGLTP